MSYAHSFVLQGTMKLKKWKFELVHSLDKRMTTLKSTFFSRFYGIEKLQRSHMFIETSVLNLYSQYALIARAEDYLCQLPAYLCASYEASKGLLSDNAMKVTCEIRNMSSRLLSCRFQVSFIDKIEKSKIRIIESYSSPLAIATVALLGFIVFWIPVRVFLPSLSITTQFVSKAVRTYKIDCAPHRRCESWNNARMSITKLHYLYYGGSKIKMKYRKILLTLVTQSTLSNTID